MALAVEGEALGVVVGRGLLLADVNGPVDRAARVPVSELSGLGAGPRGCPWGVAVSYKQGTPVECAGPLCRSCLVQNLRP